jgi:hypothetical protein
MHLTLLPLLQVEKVDEATPAEANLMRLDMGLSGFSQGTLKKTSFQPEAERYRLELDLGPVRTVGNLGSPIDPAARHEGSMLTSRVESGGGETMHYTIYRTSMQLLQDAVQQLMLVPLDEMEQFLVGLMEASGNETELERRKMKSAEGQLALIQLSRVFAGGVRSLLEAG